MPRVRYTLEQRLFMYDTYVKSGCVRTVRRRFAHKFKNVTIPHRKTIHAIVNKVRQTGSLLDKRRTVSKCRVLTEEKLDEIGARLEHFPQKSLRLIAQETGISKTSARNATILLNLKPNKTAVVHKLQSCDPANRGIHVGKLRAYIPATAVWRRMEFVNTEPDTDSERFLTSPPSGSQPNNIKTEEEPVLMTFPVMRSESEERSKCKQHNP